MKRWRLPTAQILLAAGLLLWAPAWRPLPTLGDAAPLGQKLPLTSLLNELLPGQPSDPRAPREQEASLTSPVHRGSHQSQPAPWGISGASVRPNLVPAPPMAPGVQSWSPGAGRPWVPRPSGGVHTVLGPDPYGVRPNTSEAPGGRMTVFTTAPAVPRALVTLGPAWQPAATSPGSVTPAAPFAAPRPLPGRHTDLPGSWSASGDGNWGLRTSRPLSGSPWPPERTESSAPQGPAGSLSMANTAATTGSPPPVSSAQSGLDMVSFVLPVSPRGAEGSSLDPARSDASVWTVPSAAPPSWPLSPDSPPSSPGSTPPSSAPSSTAPWPGPAPFTPAATPPADPSVSNAPLTITAQLSHASSLHPVAAATASPRPGVPASLTSSTTLTLRHTPHLPSGPLSVSEGATPAPASRPLPSQAVSWPDWGSAPQGPCCHTVRSVTFTVTSDTFSAASWGQQLLSDNVQWQLQSTFHEAFSSFRGVSIRLSRCVSAALGASVRLSARSVSLQATHAPNTGAGAITVSASLMFGGPTPGPSAREVLWALYRKVKAAGRRWGFLCVDKSSLASDGSSLADLALVTIHIRFTVMLPFLPQLGEPGSGPFMLLQGKVLRQVTPLVSAFYQLQPLGEPLLLFSDADRWVGVHLEYSFHNPWLPRLLGLADHLAWNITDPALQRSSIVVNGMEMEQEEECQGGCMLYTLMFGEKAALVPCEVWLQIRDQAFRGALKDKTSPEAQELQGTLSSALTAALRRLQHFAQVVVEEFQPEPLRARVTVTFFRAAPAPALVRQGVLQALCFLQKARGLVVEMAALDPGPGSHPSRASSQPRPAFPGYAVALFILGLLFCVFTLILVLQGRGYLPACRCLGGPKPPPRVVSEGTLTGSTTVPPPSS